MAVTFVFACLVILFNLIADLLYGWLDPRISSAERRAARRRRAARAHVSPWREAWRRFRRHRLAVSSAVVLSLMVARGRCSGRCIWRVPINDIDFTAQLQGAVAGRIRSAPTISARTCSRACSTAAASRSRSGSPRCWWRSSSATIDRRDRRHVARQRRRRR